jgi:hypothetical protein
VQCNDIFNTTMEYGGYGKRWTRGDLVSLVPYQVAQPELSKTKAGLILLHIIILMVFTWASWGKKLNSEKLLQNKHNVSKSIIPRKQLAFNDISLIFKVIIQTNISWGWPSGWPPVSI